MWYLHAAICIQDTVSRLYFDFEVCLLQVFLSDCASISTSVHFESDVCCIIQLCVDEDLVDDLGAWLLDDSWQSCEDVMEPISFSLKESALASMSCTFFFCRHTLAKWSFF